MYQIGSSVVYASHGVCKIVTTEKRRVDKKIVEYLVLEPVDKASCRYYVPLNNEMAMAKLRPLLTQADLDSLLDPDSLRADVWVEDEDLRKVKYKELISGKDISALISMIHYLHIHKDRQLEAGRKFHQCDENFLRDAQKLLETEFSLVLGLPESEVADHIQRVFICP